MERSEQGDEGFYNLNIPALPREAVGSTFCGNIKPNIRVEVLAVQRRWEENGISNAIIYDDFAAVKIVESDQSGAPPSRRDNTFLFELVALDFDTTDLDRLGASCDTSLDRDIGEILEHSGEVGLHANL